LGASSCTRCSEHTLRAGEQLLCSHHRAEQQSIGQCRLPVPCLAHAPLTTAVFGHRRVAPGLACTIVLHGPSSLTLGRPSAYKLHHSSHARHSRLPTATAATIQPQPPFIHLPLHQSIGVALGEACTIVLRCQPSAHKLHHSSHARHSCLPITTAATIQPQAPFNSHRTNQQAWCWARRAPSCCGASLALTSSTTPHTPGTPAFPPQPQPPSNHNPHSSTSHRTNQQAWRWARHAPSCCAAPAPTS